MQTLTDDVPGLLDHKDQCVLLHLTLREACSHMQKAHTHRYSPPLHKQKSPCVELQPAQSLPTLMQVWKGRREGLREGWGGGQEHIHQMKVARYLLFGLLGFLLLLLSLLSLLSSLSLLFLCTCHYKHNQTTNIAGLLRQKHASQGRLRAGAYRGNQLSAGLSL